MAHVNSAPIVLITGAAGNIGSAIAETLAISYRVIGLDLPGRQAEFPILPADFANDKSVGDAIARFRAEYGPHVASVIHLAAYFDFTGEDSPLYDTINVQGTRRLLHALQALQVDQFVYAGTMLVHEPVRPGERIDEDRSIGPKWAYPKSKAAAEEVIRREHGRIPYVLLRLAGIYDERTSVPTFSRQIARIYERDVQGHLYSGDPATGQSMLHREDMVDAFRRVVDRRMDLPAGITLLVGEADPMGYDDLQDELGRLIHGEKEWTTLRVPKPVAIAGAMVQEKLEPLIPDSIDRGEKPFVRPFMIGMADDHYALDIGRARQYIGWEPRHRLRSVLPHMIDHLKRDPAAWYEANGVTPPTWIEDARARGITPDDLRVRYEVQYRAEHGCYLWAQLFNLGFGTWLLLSPPALALQSSALTVSDMVSGAALIIFAFLSLSWRLAWARWVCAAIGVWVMSAPILFWAPTAAGYLNGMLAGALVAGFAIATPPEPGVARSAAVTGPETPPGWSYNPSAWTQRLPIIALAFIGLYISRYLAAYQLGHIDSVWEPLFFGGPDPKNGTEEIISSSVSRAWPVSDAAVGALTYLLEILTGVVGSRRRWRTMPWLVLLFGLMIVPLGVVSIFFIVIQPIWIGTWCSLCLLGAAAMLVQIPYSVDEVLATCQFLRRRRRAGKSLVGVLLLGDTDAGEDPQAASEFEASPRKIMRSVIQGGVRVTWNLGLTIAIGIWLMCTRITLGTDGSLANADHVTGALVLTVCAIASAEIASPARLLNIGLAAGLVGAAIAYDANALQLANALICGIALTMLSLRRGPITGQYGDWDRVIR